jgi:hypothetical protein
MMLGCLSCLLCNATDLGFLPLQIFALGTTGAYKERFQLDSRARSCIDTLLVRRIDKKSMLPLEQVPQVAMQAILNGALQSMGALQPMGQVKRLQEILPGLLMQATSPWVSPSSLHAWLSTSCGLCCTMAPTGPGQVSSPYLRAPKSRPSRWR